MAFYDVEKVYLPNIIISIIYFHYYLFILYEVLNIIIGKTAVR